MRLKRRIFGVFAAALAGVLLCGCTAAEDMQEHQTETPITIKVGSDNYPPFNYTDENGNPAGIDVDLAKESFGRLGYAVSFVGIDWEEKKKLVEHGDIDCIWGCFSIDGREDEYNWTEPYMISRQVVAVNRSSDIYRLSDLEAGPLPCSPLPSRKVFSSSERTAAFRLCVKYTVWKIANCSTPLSARAMWMQSRRTKPLFGSI